MATITVSSNGKYKVFSSTNATLATAIADIINELETHNIPMNKIQFNTTFDDTGQEFSFIAICRNG